MFSLIKMIASGKEVLESYFDVNAPNSLGGATRYAKYEGEKYKKVKEALEAQDAYTLHFPVRKKFKTRKTISLGVDQIWQVDLSDLQRYAVYNDNMKYILFVIDVHSRYLWLKAIPDKKGSTVATAFSDIIKENDRICALIHSDRGSEFIGKDFQNLIKNYGMRTYHTYSINKASIVERSQRTIKEKMFRYFSKFQTYKYIDILQQLAYSYNHSFHRGIGMTPQEAFEKDIRPIIEYDKATKPSQLKVGDHVRISRPYIMFRKSFEEGGWSEEIFIISKVEYKSSLYVYTIKDLNNEIIKGSFYKEELQKINIDPNVYEYKIDKILESKGKGKNKKVLVQWKGYPESFNSWVMTRDLIKRRD